MKKSLLKLSFIFPLLFIVVISACKKKEEEIVPLPLSREFQLQYSTPTDDARISFATLNENESPFVFNWSVANSKAGMVHFCFLSNLLTPALASPEDQDAQNIYFQGPNGITAWNPNVLAGITFDGGVAPNINFDALSQKDIDKNIPNDGFGGDNKTAVIIQAGQIIRFIQKDVNDVTRYKGYLKVISVDIVNIPRTVVVQAKYIKK